MLSHSSAYNAMVNRTGVEGAGISKREPHHILEKEQEIMEAKQGSKSKHNIAFVQ
jgi:hypothetical protein